MNIPIRLPILHEGQLAIRNSTKKRKMAKCGRRFGKTVYDAVTAAEDFLSGGRVLYAVPTDEQVIQFWFVVKYIFRDAIREGALIKNETRHTIEYPTQDRRRIRAKTAWNADTLRGDWGTLLELDEFQLMNEDTWGLVGAPMMLDTNGTALFTFTPPSRRSRSVTKARDPKHATKMFRAKQSDPRWDCFHFPSNKNPYLSAEALEEIRRDMTTAAYLQEIEADDESDVEGAIWRREWIDAHRVRKNDVPELVRVAVGVDPEATSGENSADTGIVAAGMDKNGHMYVLEDASIKGTPSEWGDVVCKTYQSTFADIVVGEVNNGGEMIAYVILSIDPTVNYKAVRATRGKALRAEPISVRYRNGLVHHVGEFEELEEQMCEWVPGDKSPDRLDALVWVLTELFGMDSDAVTSETVTWQVPYEERVISGDLDEVDSLCW